MRSLFILLLSLSALAAPAQTQAQRPSAAKIQVQEKAARKISLEFGSEKEIGNLLIVISDKDGQTVFLDNQYRFKGDYNKMIDLAETGAGAYTLKVVRDEDVFVQQIEIR
ncbi:MAG: hypothetical protein JWO09_2636 [Bacteroidetes bacterium]|nr:hypothetical protein [Bacteroidota bacterium]